MKTIVSTLGLLTALASGGAAQAAAVVQTYNFQGLLNDNSKTVTGSFTLLQDADTQTASLESIAFTIGSTVYTTATAFLSPNNAKGSPDAFILWGNVNNPFGQGVQGTTEDFYLTFNPFTLKTWDLAYSEAGVAVKHSTGANLTLAIPAAVPEPASWAMMIAGFGLTGAAMRRRPRTSVSFA
ncbi:MULTISPECIES: PEPxxWA-CTERM sorting domain-containing protein [Sphingomonadales]|uniref:Ice-binding protein C-terminal domain-containing protein n=1 Tax=Edaphosphingomonas haloaromaticamans TaxID=653954 RepID=A0A1S1HI56_9SPHN|nr:MULTISPECIES: PEPxxWA-CTERM sorting domain-containing protein [Sphingomonas]AGH49271.1 hypothetical protein G432_07730 [Sphingomonas sp. MM-1]MDX3886212.1 PEPxxWA-CTERM sorting domain-containing protein [Sphingomonas sp.]OHT21925.1 hypothetical protein BHE75_03940 [Sphingomonas haloaromaticamans]